MTEPQTLTSHQLARRAGGFSGVKLTLVFGSVVQRRAIRGSSSTLRWLAARL